MRSLKGQLVLLVGGSAILVVLAAVGLFITLQAAERTMERTLTAQQRLDVLAELSGRLADYGLAIVEEAGTGTRPGDRIRTTRAEVDRALRTVDLKLGSSVASADNLLSRNEFAARSRPLARVEGALGLLDRQTRQLLEEPDPARRSDGLRGAFNAFGAITGPALSFMVETERRGVERATAEAQSLMRALRIGAAMTAAAALAAVLLMHRAITRPLFARISAVNRAAAAIGQGQLNMRLPVSSRDELGLLMAAFNRMAARLARKEQRVMEDRAALEQVISQRTADLVTANKRLAEIDWSRKRFYADVSHELRTPLTVILGECDVTLRTLPRGAEALRAVFGTIRKRALRLQRRVEDLLRLARSDSGHLELVVKQVSLSSVLAEAVETFASSARQRGIALTFSPGATDVEILADPEWLRQIIEGLIDNALRHASQATRILVALKTAGSNAEVSVSDDGPGFPDAKDMLFERFSRAPVRSGPPGFGIGLALARWVVEQHGGTIGVESAPWGRGARVVIRLPIEYREVAA